jgi:Uma2 family endonuclease
MTMQPDSNQRARHGARRYRRAPEPLHFPGSEPMTEFKPHFSNRVLLYDCLRTNFGNVACVGSSQFVYWDASDPRVCAAPDVFLRLGMSEKNFGIWKVWEYGAPQLAVEIASEDDRNPRVWATKLERYRRLGVEELVWFDADCHEQPIRIWDRVEGDFVERSLDSPGLAECGPLGVFWTIVEDPSLGPMLRLSRDPEGKDLLPTAAEVAERERDAAERERDAAERVRDAAERERDALLERVRELEAKVKSEL